MSQQFAKSEKPLGVAIVGTGGQNLARIFDALGVLRAVCDLAPTCPGAFAGVCPDVLRTTDMVEALRDPHVTGVAVAGPVQARSGIVRQALAAGKHVLVQAPMALSESDAADLIGAAKDKGLLLMAGHPVLLHPAFVRLRKMVAAGELGRIEYIYTNSLGCGDDAGGEDAARFAAVRGISMILGLAGSLPLAVLTSGDAQMSVAHLTFAADLKAHCFVSRLHPFKEQKLVVVGERKMAIFDDVLPWADKLLLYPQAISRGNRTSASAKVESVRVDVPLGEPLDMQCRQFLDAMASGRPPCADGSESLQALRVYYASRKSLEEGASRVALDAAAAVPTPDHFVHPTAVVDAGAKVGAGSKIWHFSHVLKGSRLGEKCNLGQNVVVGPDVSVGSGCKIQNNVSVYQGVTLEDDVFCGPSMVFTNIFNPRAHIPRMHEVRQTLVKKGAALGANCTIVCGVAVGRYAFVGAGAVVTRDVPDHAVVVGNPARRIGWMCACGEKLDETLRCAVCGAAYAEGETGLRRL